MEKICPRCGKKYTAPSALSRIDNATAICPECGVHEALDSIDILPEYHDKILDMMGDVNNQKEED